MPIERPAVSRKRLSLPWLRVSEAKTEAFVPTFPQVEQYHAGLRCVDLPKLSIFNGLPHRRQRFLSEEYK